MAKYAPTIDVAVVSFVEEEMTYTDRSTGEKKSFARRTLNCLAPELGLVVSCPVPERLVSVCQSVGVSKDYKPNARLVLASFCYEHSQLKITLDSVESITKKNP